MNSWKKIKSEDRKLENILTRFNAKLKPLQEQLEAEIDKLRKTVGEKPPEGDV